MAEQAVRISSETHDLEGAYEPGVGTEGVVLCHPHPLYGGDMDNNVVMVLKRSLGAEGWSTLRFNFRGVGASGGTSGDGKGEVEDLFAAVDFLVHRGLNRIHLAGYSFGAWIALHAVRQSLKCSTLLLISPPIGFLDFSDLTLPPVPTLVTLGDADDCCSPSLLHKWLECAAGFPTAVQIKVLEGCDHFYRGHESRLHSITRDFVRFLADSDR